MFAFFCDIYVTDLHIIIILMSTWSKTYRGLVAIYGACKYSQRVLPAVEMSEPPQATPKMANKVSGLQLKGVKKKLTVNGMVLLTIG